jgi:hypothetical protein
MATKTVLLQHLDPRAKKGDHQRVACMLTQLGAISRSTVYGEHAADRKERLQVAAYKAEKRIALADLVAQCRLMAEEEGWDYRILEEDGHERFIERMDELRKGVI